MKLTDMFNMMQRLRAGPVELSAEDQGIVGLMEKYFSEMYEIEKEDEGKAGRRESSEAMLKRLDASIKRQKEVHARYWCNNSPFYEPSSTTTDPDHDWKRVTSIKVLRNGDDNGPLFLFVFGYMDTNIKESRLHCYGIRVVGGEPKIEHLYH